MNFQAEHLINGTIVIYADWAKGIMRSLFIWNLDYVMKHFEVKITLQTPIQDLSSLWLIADEQQPSAVDVKNIMTGDEIVKCINGRSIWRIITNSQQDDTFNLAGEL